MSVKVCWLDSFSKQKSPDYGLAGARWQESRQCWARGLSFPPSLSPLGLLMSPLPPPPGWEIVLVLVNPQWVWGICVRPGNPAPALLPVDAFLWRRTAAGQPRAALLLRKPSLPAAGSEMRAALTLGVPSFTPPCSLFILAGSTIPFPSFHFTRSYPSDLSSNTMSSGCLGGSVG